MSSDEARLSEWRGQTAWLIEVILVSKDYFKTFFMDTFYNQKEKNIKDSIPNFLTGVFEVDKPFSKSDLDILTELYKLMEKNIN